MPPRRLSDLTTEEIAAAILAVGKKRKFPPGTCPMCEQQFIPLRSWQKYCSPECRTKHFDSRTKEEMNAAVLKIIEENRALRKQVDELQEKLREIGASRQTGSEG